MTGSVQWSASWTSPSAMIESEPCTQQDNYEGAALDWWESDPVRDREAFTWIQFRERFRSHNVPAGVMKMKEKEKEFLALKQVILSIIIQRFLLS